MHGQRAGTAHVHSCLQRILAGSRQAAAQRAGQQAGLAAAGWLSSSLQLWRALTTHVQADHTRAGRLLAAYIRAAPAAAPAAPACAQRAQQRARTRSVKLVQPRLPSRGTAALTTAAVICRRAETAAGVTCRH